MQPVATVSRVIIDRWREFLPIRWRSSRCVLVRSMQFKLPTLHKQRPQT